MRSLGAGLVPCLLLLCVSGCSKQKQPTTAPTAANADDAAAAEAEASDEEAEAEKGPKDTLRVATFNLQWAHDHEGEDTAAGKKARAKDEAAWKWKASAIGKVLAESAPDIVALQELGGEGEALDIIAAIKEAKGPDYDFAFLESEDPFSGHQLAILSTYPLSEVRRLDIHLRRHLAVDVQLPDEQQLTVIAIHAPEGPRSKGPRQKQVKALKRAVDGLRAQNPVMVLGTLGSGIEPGDAKYDADAAGMLAGRSTKNEDDDCADAADVGVVLSTTRGGTLADRIYACGVEMVEAQAVEDGIVRGMPDPDDKPWSAIAVDKDEERDVSDHLLVVATVKRPKPAPPPKEEGADEGGEKPAGAEGAPETEKKDG